MAAKRTYPLFEGGASAAAKKRKDDEPLKIFSWNVAGLRGCIKKNGHEKIEESNADIVILQESKCPELPPEIVRMKDYAWKKLCTSNGGGGNHAGVVMLSREKPKKFNLGIGDDRFDHQGRMIHAEYDNFHFIGVYTPNSGRGLVNLEKRKVWDELFLAYVAELDKDKPVIMAGDFNVAHQEIDLKNPNSNRNKTAGFTDQERDCFTSLLDKGFVDVYRKMNPEKEGAYTFWSYLHSARDHNVGWRLDYFLVSERIFDKVGACEIERDTKGSDHCPITLTINI